MRKLFSGFILLFIFLEMSEKCIFEVLYKNNEFFKKEDNSFSLVW